MGGGGEMLAALSSPQSPIRERPAQQYYPKLTPPKSELLYVLWFVKSVLPRGTLTLKVLPKTYPSQVWSVICAMTCKIRPSQRDFNPIRPFRDGWGEYMASTFSPLLIWAEKLQYPPIRRNHSAHLRLTPPEFSAHCGHNYSCFD